MRVYFSILIILVVSLNISCNSKSTSDINVTESQFSWSDCLVDTTKSFNNVDSLTVQLNETSKYIIDPQTTVCKLVTDTVVLIPTLFGYINNEIVDYEIFIKVLKNKYSINIKSYNTIKSFYRRDTILYKTISQKLTINKNKIELNDSLIFKIYCNSINPIYNDTIRIYGKIKVKLRDSTCNFGILNYEKSLPR